MTPRLLLAVAVAVAFAEPLHASGAFDVYATSTLRVEHYDVDDDALPLYPDDGWQSYGELTFDAKQQISPYETLHLRGSGLANDSAYRSHYDTYSSENLAATWEKGDVALPFRLDGGDYFGFYSYRTLQRSLKGAQVELQPGGDGRQSILLSAGAVQPTYRDFDADEDSYVGASWRFEPLPGAGLSANVVHNQRESTDLFDSRDQTVGSIAAESRFRWLEQDLALQVEAAYLSGEVDLLDDHAGESVDGRGLFAELSGRNSRRVDYRLRYEDYGNEFFPNGGVVSPDRVSSEAHLGWRSLAGLQLAGRYQRYREGEGAGNAFDTDVVGLRIGKALGGGRASAALDAFVSRREDELGFADNRTKSVRVDVMGALTSSLSGRFGIQYQRTDDDAFGFDQRISQLDLGIDHRGSAAAWTWQIGPRLVLRTRHSGTSDGTDVGPGISFAVQRGIHALYGGYTYLGQRVDQPIPDNANQAATLAYSATSGPHRFAFELERRERETDGDPLNRGDRVALVYTFTLDSRAGAPTFGAVGGGASPSAAPGAFDALTFACGLTVGEAKERLTAEGFGDATPIGNLLVYDARVLTEVPLRQRLVIETANGFVESTTLLVDFDSTAAGSALAQQYETARAALLDRYGAPTRSFDQGSFAADAAAALSSSRVVRLSEWDLGAGVLRLGIPVRLDGVVRIEARYGDALPSAQTRWGLDALF